MEKRTSLILPEGGTIENGICFFLAALLVLVSLPAAGQRRIPQDEKVTYELTVGDAGMRDMRGIYHEGNVTPSRIENARQASGRTPQWWPDFLQKRTAARHDDYCFDLYTEPVYERPQIGDRATVLNLGGAAQLVQLVEIAPNSQTEWHGYGWEGEALFLVIQGKGETRYRSVVGGLPPNKYEWKKNTLFAVPVDHQVRHYNSNPATPARILVAVGYGVNVYPYISEGVRVGKESRAEGSERKAATLERTMYAGHYVEDLGSHPVPLRDAQGDPAAFFNLLSTVGHRTHPYVQISELTGEQSKAQKHDNQLMFVILKGAGYNMWSEAEDLAAYQADLAAGRAHKSPIKEGTLCGIPGGPHWYQHFSTHPTEPLRYLTIIPRGEYAKKPTSLD